MRMRTLVTILVVFALTTVCALAANVSGKWAGEMPGRQGGNPRPVVLELKADGATLTGTMGGGQRQNEISEGKVDGDNVSFVVKMQMQGNEVKQMYKGKVTGDEMKLTVQREGSDNVRELTLKRAQ